MNTLGAVGEGLAELTVGEKRAELGFGGDMANVCVMAAHAGANARLAGRVGQDALGSRLLTFLQEEGVDIGEVRRDPAAPTGLYVNETQPGRGHRFTYWRTGSAGSRLEPADLGASFFADLAVLVVSGVTLAVSPSSAITAEHAMAQVKDRNVSVACVLNHRPPLGGDIEQLAAIARASDIVIASMEDVAAVFGTVEPAAVGAMLGLGPSEVVLTDGERPATVSFGGHVSSQPIPSVLIRNAAGAGDALAGAYLAMRLRGSSPGLSLRWGVAAATLSVQREGCADSYPSRDEVRELALTLG